MKITANGIKDGNELEVKYENGNFLFNEEQSFTYETEIRHRMSERYAIGGTFYVDEDDDVRNIVNVLREHFFDKTTLDIRTSDPVEDIPIDAGKGGVY